MPDFNWVTARAGCSVVKMFVRLRLEVERDLQAALAVSRENPRKFGLIEEANKFTVYEETIPVRSVSFALNADGTAIVVTNEKGLRQLSATVSLNDHKECVFVVDGAEMENWQLRRKALELFFFPSSR